MESTHVTPSPNSPEYLGQLLKDKRQLQALPGCFTHLERILDEEISRVRGNVLSLSSNSEPLQLPEPSGQVVTLSEKLTVPIKEHPDFNFVGRLLGPRGMTAKQLEVETGCKILVRGRGSMRDKHKEDTMRGKAKWEHLNEDLHVLITVEDTKNRATIKLQQAVEQVSKLLVPSPECEDELKKRQLMELALMNGTYRGFQDNNNAIAINNNNNNIHNNNNGVGLLMMAAGPPFCTAGLPGAALLPPHHGGPQLVPIIVPSDNRAGPIILAGPPPMFPAGPCPGSVAPLPSPNIPPPPLVSPAMCKNQMALPLPPMSHGIIYHQIDPACTANASAGSMSSPVFEFPMTSPGVEQCHPLPASMTSYVH